MHIYSILSSSCTKWGVQELITIMFEWQPCPFTDFPESCHCGDSVFSLRRWLTLTDPHPDHQLCSLPLSLCFSHYFSFRINFSFFLVTRCLSLEAAGFLSTSLIIFLRMFLNPSLYLQSTLRRCNTTSSWCEPLALCWNLNTKEYVTYSGPDAKKKKKYWLDECPCPKASTIVFRLNIKKSTHWTKETTVSIPSTIWGFLFFFFLFIIGWG